MKKSYIFDIDGTLIDTERTGVESLIKTVKELMNIDMPYEEAYGYFGFPSGRVPVMLNYNAPEEFMELWERNFISLKYLSKAFPGVEDILRELHQEGCHIGCVTSRNRFEVENDEHLKPLLKYIEVEICVEDCVNHKPHPEPALTFLERIGMKAEDCMFIGDTIQDCQCAHASGIPFLLADWHKRGMRDIPADAIASDAQQMLAILKA